MRGRWMGAVAVGAALGVAACGGGGGNDTSGGSTKNQTITVWDYYGKATPIKPAVQAYEKAHPNIKIRYEAFDYATLQEKFATAVSGGTPPDLVTLDMTWIPTYAATGLLANVSDLSKDKINGQPFASRYTPGALQAMRDGDHYVSALYDFDAYALYYRRDLLRKAKVNVPANWDELKQAATKLAAAAPKQGKWRVQVQPDTFHFAQLLYQAGGSILDPSNKKAVFAGPQGVKALTEMKDLLAAGGLYWGDDEGDVMQGIKDDRIAMFLNGPYMMGILKDGAPDQSGKWAVAPAPIDLKPASYLGGTGLSIPANAKHKQAAWDFAQFLLRPDQQLALYKFAGAAPATTDALKSPELTKPDAYFGDQAPFKVFLGALASAKPYPYVRQWNDIDRSIRDAVTAALLNKKSPQDSLTGAAREVDQKLAG